MRTLTPVLWHVAGALLLLLHVEAASAEVPPFAPGRIIESVSCVADASQSYSLYLPAQYTADRAWPVLYCLDPGGRGKQPVERFKQAADKFGFVIVGSNNSRNGPLADNAKGIETMMADTAARLSIDRRRVYLAGYSGGARLASQLAAAGFARGVIACGGTFPQSEIPAEVKCLYYGVAGVDDFNYPEHRRIDEELERRGALHRFAVFAGGHEWLPSDAAIAAVEWLEIQSMRVGLRQGDAVIIAESVRGRKARLQNLPVAERWLETRSMVADFSGIVTTDALQKSADELAQKPEVAEWRKLARAMARQQNATIGKLLGGAGGSLVARLRAQASAADDSTDRRVARRSLQGAYIAAWEDGRRMLSEQDHEGAVNRLALAVELEPDRASTFFDLARACALAGDRGRALRALNDAEARGYKDADRLKREKCFESLSDTEEFRAICRKVQENARLALEATAR